ncbi:hypothetical protein TI39_contig426g00003 [Zymoseptoria brevis]|uniref:Uncharacterized protein n=1 Tax=Zymoseptoria brevis TaxID=1047168 RepID=A0A0F4GLD0_9PEZI|nr:hypothetical protein TI39_contig426g00003 [Zymoseptoria brevis]
MSGNEHSRRSPPPPAPASGDGASSPAPAVAAATRVSESSPGTGAAGSAVAASRPDLATLIASIGMPRRAGTFPFDSEEAPANRATVLAAVATAEQAGREARDQSVVLSTYVPLSKDELTWIEVLKISSTKLARFALVLLGSLALLLSTATTIITETSIAHKSSCAQLPVSVPLRDL